MGPRLLTADCFVRRTIVSAIHFRHTIEAVLAKYKPAYPVTARELAETIVAIIEGGFILSRSYNDPVAVARLSRQFRQYIELLFALPRGKRKA